MSNEGTGLSLVVACMSMGSVMHCRDIEPAGGRHGGGDWADAKPMGSTFSGPSNTFFGPTVTFIGPTI